MKERWDQRKKILVPVSAPGRVCVAVKCHPTGEGCPLQGSGHPTAFPGRSLRAVPAREPEENFALLIVLVWSFLSVFVTQHCTPARVTKPHSETVQGFVTRSWSLYYELFPWKIETTHLNWWSGICVFQCRWCLSFHICSACPELCRQMLCSASLAEHTRNLSWEFHYAVGSKPAQFFCFSSVLQVLLGHHWSSCTRSVPWKQTTGRAKPSTSATSSTSKAAGVKCSSMADATAMRTTS